MTDTMYDAVNGSTYTALTAGVGASDTTIAVDTTEYLPDAPNIVNIYHTVNGEITKWERCKYTVKTATTLTIERTGTEHSSSGLSEEGLSFVVGDRVARLFTGWDHRAFKGNIEQNATDIDTNAAGISTNAGLISDNAADITALDGRVTTNEGNISTNVSNIATNASDIADMPTAVQTLENKTIDSANNTITIDGGTL